MINRLSCSQCDKKFAQAYILKTHKRIHTDEKPFSCKRCDYKCKPSTALKTHERIYTNEKPFSCSQCDYKCSTSGSLRRIKEPTLVISHSAAQSVTGYPVSQGARIAFTNMLGHSQEPTIYSPKELCSDQNSPAISVDC